ncbi:MAG TPA: hypothetical protein VE996_01425 [Terriglobales bacterium]|nr:hypothetical protein [Terriglobales bacterium]
MTSGNEPMPKLVGFSVKCGRCGAVFTTKHCVKLDHFGIYRVPCPRCQWPGRYLATELHPVPESPEADAQKPGEARRE